MADYITTNHHLPEIPSAKEVEEMQSKLLAKIEELILHMIQAEERSGRIEGENRELRNRVLRLEGSQAGAR